MVVIIIITVRLKFRRKRGKNLSAVGPKELFEVIKKLYKGKSNGNYYSCD